MVYYKDKTIWITGASSGIGMALARALDIEGVNLILSARSENKLKELSTSLSRARSLVLPMDLSQSDTFESVANQAEQAFDSIDILINNAGISQRSEAMATDTVVERQIMEVNFFGNIALSKAVLNSMRSRKQGHLVIMSSVGGKFGLRLRSTYSASKHALHGYYESLRMEEKKNGIRVTLVCPGRIDTSISTNAMNADGIRHGKKDQNQSAGMDVNRCAAQILKGIKNQKMEIFVVGKERRSARIKRLLPRFL